MGGNTHLGVFLTREPRIPWGRWLGSGGGDESNRQEEVEDLRVIGGTQSFEY